MRLFAFVFGARLETRSPVRDCPCGTHVFVRVQGCSFIEANLKGQDRILCRFNYVTWGGLWIETLDHTGQEFDLGLTCGVQGKTYSLAGPSLGGQQRPGVPGRASTDGLIPRSIDYAFESIQSQIASTKIDVSASCCEIYNEQVGSSPGIFSRYLPSFQDPSLGLLRPSKKFPNIAQICPSA